MKYLVAPLIIGAISLGGCNSKTMPKNRAINNSVYSVSKNSIVQTKSSFLDDGIIKIGVVSDIEGAVKNAKESANKLKSQNLDAMIIAGDCYENEQIRRFPVYPNSTNNLKEMIKGIEPYAKLGVPVFIIPGNHEVQSVYKNAIKELQKDYPNVFDINKKSVDLEGVNLVGMGGYHDLRFLPRNGFLLNPSDYAKAEKNLEEFQIQKEPEIFITHGPPKSRTLIDFVQNAGHVGDLKIEKIMNSPDLENIINVHGHIHEGGGNFDKYKAGIAINIASITDYSNPKGFNTGVISIKNGRKNTAMTAGPLKG